MLLPLDINIGNTQSIVMFCWGSSTADDGKTVLFPTSFDNAAKTIAHRIPNTPAYYATHTSIDGFVIYKVASKSSFSYFAYGY